MKPVKSSFNNPNKNLVPYGKSKQLFLNLNPIKVPMKFVKDRPQGKDTFYINERPLFQLGGMIYWLCLGDKQFDIREFRKKAGMKTEYKSDMDFDHPCNRFKNMIDQIDKVGQKHNLDEYLSDLLCDFTKN